MAKSGGGGMAKWWWLATKAWAQSKPRPLLAWCPGERRSAWGRVVRVWPVRLLGLLVR